jgi:hypothetical protein
MVLLNRMIRTAAVTGRTYDMSAWFGGRQGGRWAEQTVRGAFPHMRQPAQATAATGRAPTAAESAETLQQLTALHERGIVTDAEFEKLRADLNG